MKRIFCMLLVVMMAFSLCAQAFADGDFMYCRMCGKQIPSDSKVCTYCGEKVVLISDSAASPASEAAPGTSPAATASDASQSTLSTATDVKTALSQSSAPSPATPSTAAAPASAVPGPFNTTISANGTSAGRVYVTKSPTSESVPYGGSCMFIANAVNATSVTWYLASPDLSLICAAYDAPSSVSGLYVSGANSNTLYLSGIPSWLNGCHVQACFTGEGGPVYTETARIWTYQPVQQVSSGSWSWWDWVNCNPWNDPCYPDYPIIWNPWPVEKPHVAPSFHPELDTEPAEVVHVGHYNPLDPWGSWWDPSGTLGSMSHSYSAPDSDPGDTGGSTVAGGGSGGSNEPGPPPPWLNLPEVEQTDAPGETETES